MTDITALVERLDSTLSTAESQPGLPNVIFIDGPPGELSSAVVELADQSEIAFHCALNPSTDMEDSIDFFLAFNLTEEEDALSPVLAFVEARDLNDLTFLVHLLEFQQRLGGVKIVVAIAAALFEEAKKVDTSRPLFDRFLLEQF